MAGSTKDTGPAIPLGAGTEAMKKVTALIFTRFMSNPDSSALLFWIAIREEGLTMMIIPDLELSGVNDHDER